MNHSNKLTIKGEKIANSPFACRTPLRCAQRRTQTHTHTTYSAVAQFDCFFFLRSRVAIYSSHIYRVERDGQLTWIYCSTTQSDLNSSANSGWAGTRQRPTASRKCTAIIRRTAMRERRWCAEAMLNYWIVLVWVREKRVCDISFFVHFLRTFDQVFLYEVVNVRARSGS